MTQIAREVEERMQQLDPALAVVFEQIVRGALDRIKPVPDSADRPPAFTGLPTFDTKPKPGIDFSRIEQDSWDYE